MRRALLLSGCVVAAALAAPAAALDLSGLLGTWQTRSSPDWRGFERITFAAHAMYVPGVGEIAVRRYRITRRRVVASTRFGETYAFEIHGELLCLPAVRPRLIGRPGARQPAERRCYRRVSRGGA